MDILIVDDARDQRLILSKVLEKQGHNIHLAENGYQALTLLESHNKIQLVISDWMMPEMDGVELCRQIRSRNLSRYIYFLMLTGKTDDDAVIHGMGVGADDFLTKPINFKELKARLKAGKRVVELEKSLAASNRKIREALDTVETDLKSAADTLTNLLPQPSRLHQTLFDWRFQPSKILGGDMLGYQVLDAEHIAFYQVDVSGHGVPSALFSFSLNHLLSDVNPSTSVLLSQKAGSSDLIIRSPEKVVSILNERFQMTTSNTMYFTMVYGILHSPSGKVSLTYAGHPPSLVITSAGEISPVNGAGAPVGMVPDFPYECEYFTLNQGDSLLCYTDGVTECMNSKCEFFGTNKLVETIKPCYKYSPNFLLDSVMDSLHTWQNSDTFNDDVSCMLLKIDNDKKIITHNLGAANEL